MRTMMSATTPQSEQYSYFRQGFVPESQAVLPIQNQSFLYGTSLFEGIRGYWEPEQNAISIFRAKEHFERLLRNANIFGMLVPESIEDCLNIVAELIKKNGLKTDTYLRPTIFKDGCGVGPSLEKFPNSLSIFTTPLGAYVDIENGLSVCVSSWRRNSDNAIPPRAKAGGAYMNTALIKTQALRDGYDDAIVLTQDGHVSEGSAMNLFMVRRGKLVTPAITEDILEGITRDTIIELATKELGMPVEERTVDRSELYVADELFFCGTGAQVAPITSVDRQPVGTGEIGEWSKQLQDLYFKVVKNQVPQYSHWCQVVPLD
jgi:branched-chain amino acid aminotransferase